MAQRLDLGRSKPLTHNEQNSLDQSQAAGVFLSSVCTLAEVDQDLSQQESAVLLNSTQDACVQMGMREEEDIRNIGQELRTIADQVDDVADGYSQYFDEILTQEDSNKMADVFLQVGNRVFDRGVTLQGIVVLLVFCYKLVKLYMRKLRENPLETIKTALTVFVVKACSFLAEAFIVHRVLQWVRQKGGWQQVLDHWPKYAIGVGIVLVLTGLAIRYWKP